MQVRTHVDSARSLRLKLRYCKLLSRERFNFNLRPYTADEILLGLGMPVLITAAPELSPDNGQTATFVDEDALNNVPHP
jgi:hypothetical protein